MHTPEQQELLAKVEQLKREKKYSQNEVAKVIGISGTALSQVKNENYPADPQSIFDIIANYFGVKEKAKLTYTEIDYAPQASQPKFTTSLMCVRSRADLRLQPETLASVRQKPLGSLLRIILQTAF